MAWTLFCARLVDVGKVRYMSGLLRCASKQGCCKLRRVISFRSLWSWLLSCLSRLLNASCCTWSCKLELAIARISLYICDWRASWTTICNRDYKARERQDKSQCSKDGEFYSSDLIASLFWRTLQYLRHATHFLSSTATCNKLPYS